MTKKEMKQGALKIGDYVRIATGGLKSRENIWKVVEIYDYNKNYDQYLISLELVYGLWGDWDHGPVHYYGPGFIKKTWSRSVKKINSD